jgi:hypothetical protein
MICQHTFLSLRALRFCHPGGALRFCHPEGAKRPKDLLRINSAKQSNAYHGIAELVPSVSEESCLGFASAIPHNCSSQ